MKPLLKIMDHGITWGLKGQLMMSRSCHGKSAMHGALFADGNHDFFLRKCRLNWCCYCCSFFCIKLLEKKWGHDSSQHLWHSCFMCFLLGVWCSGYSTSRRPAEPAQMDRLMGPLKLVDGFDMDLFKMMGKLEFSYIYTCIIIYIYIYSRIYIYILIYLEIVFY